MKKISAVLIVLCLLFTLCGCSANKNDSPDLETQYYEYAQECIASGDTETAIKALEEGIEKTDSEKLKELLATIKEDKADSENNSSINESNPESSQDNSSGTENPSNTQSSSVPENSSSDNSSQEEVVADICGFYTDGYTNYTVYKKNGSYKVFIETSGYGGYFALKSKGGNTYSVAYNGTDYNGGGNTDLDTIIYAKSVTMKFNPQSGSVTVKTVLGYNSPNEGATFNDTLKKNSNIDVSDFKERY